MTYPVNHLPFEERIKRSRELNTLLEDKSTILKSLEEEHHEIYQKMVTLQNITPGELLTFSDRNHTAIINYYIGDRFYNPDKK